MPVISKLLFQLAIGIALILCPVFWAQASPTDKVILLAYSNEGWPPYFMPQGSPQCGMIMDILNAAAKPLGYTFQAVYYPDARSARLLKQGAVDAWPKARDWVPAPEKFYWSVPLTQVQDTLVFRNDGSPVFSYPEQMLGKTIGTVYNYKYPIFGPYFANARISRSDSKDALSQLKMLLRGRIDAVLMNKDVALWTMSHTPGLKKDSFVLAPEAVSTVDYRLMFTKAHDWEPFLKKFATQIEAIRQDGRYAQVLERYHNRTITP